MKSDRPSRTAQFVTIGRAMADLGLSHIPNFSDPTARVFLSDKGKKGFAKVEKAWRAQKRSYRVESARVMADMIGLRTAAIDSAVRNAIAEGATQLVILGAGYDGRAWRMKELAGVHVYEVDHPATQNDKRTRAAALPNSPQLTFVPVNFEREKLDDVLTRAGHDPAQPTCWIWEGVVMYLTRDAMHATLADVASRSAAGSTLIVNYHTTVKRGWFTALLLRFIGEPQISHWSPEEMAADLKAVGFTVSHDFGMLDWNAQFADGKAKVSRAPYMRIAVARN